MIDYGLSKKYRSSQSNKHVQFRFTGKLTGTVRFASTNAVRGWEQGRRDDIESIGYLLIYFMKGSLPWQGVKSRNKLTKYFKIYQMKKEIKPSKLCEGLPIEIETFIDYSKKLDFEQEPNYGFLRSLFAKILEKNL